MLELALARRSLSLGLAWGDHDVVTVKEAASWLRLSEKTIYRYCERGELPHQRIPGGCIRFRRDDLESWLEERRVAQLRNSAPRPSRQSGVGRGSRSKRVSSSDGLSARELGDRLRRGEGWE